MTWGGCVSRGGVDEGCSVVPGGKKKRVTPWKPSQGGVRDVTRVEKSEIFKFVMNETICLDRALQAGTWARTECHGGRPIFVTQQMSQN